MLKQQREYFLKKYSKEKMNIGNYETKDQVLFNLDLFNYSDDAKFLIKTANFKAIQKHREYLEIIH